MANEKAKTKDGMQGKTTQTERWGKRSWVDVKEAARKQRRREDKHAARAPREYAEDFLKDYRQTIANLADR